jgi:hypothetical protein
MNDFSDLKAKAEKADDVVPGPGVWLHPAGEHTVYASLRDGSCGIAIVRTDYSRPNKVASAILDYIAASNPATILSLLGQLEAMRMELDAWKNRYSWKPIDDAPTHQQLIVWREDSGPFLAQKIQFFEVPEAESDSEEWGWLSNEYGWQEGSETPTHYMLPPTSEPDAALATSQEGGKT